MSDTPTSGIELTKELLGTAIKPEDTGEELAKKQQRFNLILDGIVSMSAGLTLGAVTGTISTFRMLTDKKNGRLPKTLQNFPTALLVQRIYRGHFIRGIVAAVGAACAYGAVTQTEELSKFQMPAVVRGFIPGAVGGALMGNLKAATARTLSYAVAGGVVGSIYCKVTQETTLLKIQLPYAGKRGFEDSLR